MYDFGSEDAPEDNIEALRWYRKAAEQEHTLAQYSLAVMYDGGGEDDFASYPITSWTTVL